MIVTPGQSGVDYASARPPVALMAQRGVRFVCRYLTEYGLKGKALTPAELAQLTSAGIPVVLNYEHGELTMMAGTNAGQIAAQEAIAAAKKLGAPHGTCIVYSHDTGAWSSLVPLAFQAAYDATVGAGYTFGIYASKQCVQACLDRGMVVSIIWATNALAWGGGRHPDAHVWQGRTNIDMSGLGNLDPNLCMRPFNAWLPGEHIPDIPIPPPFPQPSTPPIPGANIMIRVLTVDDLAGKGVWLFDPSTGFHHMSPVLDASFNGRLTDVNMGRAAVTEVCALYGFPVPSELA